MCQLVHWWYAAWLVTVCATDWWYAACHNSVLLVGTVCAAEVDGWYTAWHSVCCWKLTGSILLGTSFTPRTALHLVGRYNE